jgi:AraC-like DNA-binding protein
MQLRPSPVLEQIPLSGPASVTIREFRHSSFRYPWHQHPEIELTWIIKGSGLRYVGDSVEPFHPGDFCLLGSNLPHTWLSPEKNRQAVQSLVIQFDPNRWGSDFLHLPEFAKILDLFKRAARGLTFHNDLGMRLKKRMICPSSPLKKLTGLLDSLQELAEDTTARSLTLAPWGGNHRTDSDPRIRTLLEFLSKNAGAPLTQKEAAQRVHLSPAAFSRFFRRCVGKTFSTYLTDIRLSDACRRLLESGAPITRIAFDSGFENLSTFNRSFRRARGMSPRLFRQQARGRVHDLVNASDKQPSQ